MLRLALPCAVRHSLSFFCREQSKKSMHDTQCINRLGLFRAPVIFGIHMMRGE